MKIFVIINITALFFCPEGSDLCLYWLNNFSEKTAPDKKPPGLTSRLFLVYDDLRLTIKKTHPDIDIGYILDSKLVARGS